MKKILHIITSVLFALLLLFSADGRHYVVATTYASDSLCHAQRECSPVKMAGRLCSIAALPGVTQHFKIAYRVVCRFFPASKDQSDESVFYKQYTFNGLHPKFARVTTSQPILRI